MAKTLTFDERVKGWTSFHSFIPEAMISLNGRFFTFKNGQLYLHNDPNVNRNEFYGVSYPSKISLMVNDSPSDIKELKAISLEGNVSWDALIRAYVSDTDDFIESSIQDVEFVKKEGIWYAHTRRNESTTHFDSKSTYGIGEVTSVVGNTIIINGHSSSLTTNDSLVKGSDISVVGNIDTINYNNGLTTLELSSVVGTVSTGDFVLGMKDARVEGGNLRGYTMRVDLETNNPLKVELFAVNSEVFKSFR